MPLSAREALARLVDLFGPSASWDPTQLYGNLTVSPNGNIIMGSLLDDGVHKLQVNGAGIITGGLTVQGAAGLVFPDGSAASTSRADANRITNGACLVNQRGPVSVTASGILGGVDRFNAGNPTALGAFTQGQGSFTWNGVVRPCVSQTVTTAVSAFSAAASLWSGIRQVIPGYDCFDLVGQPISVSFLFYTNVVGTSTFAAAVIDGTGAHSYVQTFTAVGGVVQLVKLTFPASAALVIPSSIAAGLYVSVGAVSGTTYQAPALNSWQAGNYLSATTVTNWAAAVNNVIALTEFQVEAGPICTPFNRKKFEEYLHDCQYFFCKTFPYATVPANWTGNAGAIFMGTPASANYWGIPWKFPRAMRTTPAFNYYNPNASATGTAGYWYDQGGANANSAPGTISQNELGANILLNAGAAITPAGAGAWYIHAIANADL